MSEEDAAQPSPLSQPGATGPAASHTTKRSQEEKPEEKLAAR